MIQPNNLHTAVPVDYYLDQGAGGFKATPNPTYPTYLRIPNTRNGRVTGFVTFHAQSHYLFQLNIQFRL